MSATTWEHFRTRYESEWVCYLRPNTRLSVASALNAAEKLLSPQTPSDLLDLNKFWKAAIRTLKPSSVTTYCKKLDVALKWAKRRKMVAGDVIQPDVPRKPLKKQPKPPLTEEQLSTLLNAADALGSDTAMLIRGLAYSGMRINEAEQLSWSGGAQRMDLAKQTFLVDASGDKTGRDRIVPMTPEFYDLVSAVSPDERKGYVFMPNWQDRAKLRRRVLRVGETVKESLGRKATPHDYRRTFGSAWAMKVEALVLQRLMRHDSLNTTLRFYVRVEADAVVKAIQGMRVFG